MQLPQIYRGHTIIVERVHGLSGQPLSLWMSKVDGEEIAANPYHTRKDALPLARHHVDRLIAWREAGYPRE